MLRNPSPRACKECGAAFKPTRGNQQHCEAHSKVARVMQSTMTARVCRNCKREFQPASSSAVYCAVSCRKTAERLVAEERRRKAYGLRSCACGVTFLPRFENHRRCDVCANRAAVIASKPRPSLPCFGCRHGQESSRAELGVECVIERWGACNPLVAARLYTPQEAAQ